MNKAIYLSQTFLIFFSTFKFLDFSVKFLSFKLSFKFVFYDILFLVVEAIPSDTHIPAFSIFYS